MRLDAEEEGGALILFRTCGKTSGGDGIDLKKRQRSPKSFLKES
ncbi:hypothetical protein J2TS6_37830 [Paenibacillus albilobatus]|uniref:Uncharacterized protein n=1 Tax=Paenibacillus albilobatus TaxID=2716884 RepID=A0A919XGY9_9BACL|nr:hypothetical protein J2TS6_37830 [Paenibacillus albilobatus]